MDSHIILEFAAEKDALAVCDKMHEIECDRAIAAGYIVMDGEIVGRNALTGKSQFEAQRTVRYAVPAESPDKTFYIPRPEDAGYKTALAAKGVAKTGTEKEFPPEWEQEETP